MKKMYTDEIATLQLISILKAHNINQIIVSPGNTDQLVIWLVD